MAEHPTTPATVFHYSEDPGIERFVPHVPATNPSMPPLVWDIDRGHAPAYWFPRDCPRATWWEPGRWRVHAIDASWETELDRVCLHEYTLPAATFRPWPDADGHWVSEAPVVSSAVRPLPSARELHRQAGVDLRVVADLRSLVDEIVETQAHFSVIRLHNLGDPASGG